MPRSLLDAADLASIRAAARRRGGPGAMPVACLVEGRAFAHDPADPQWPDRDRLVVAAGPLESPVKAALAEAGHRGGGDVTVVAAGRGLAVAAGAAAALALDGAVARVYCLLDGAALDDGATWEAALAGEGRRLAGAGPFAGAAAPALTAVLVVTPTEAERARGLFAAAGWRTAVAAAEDPAEVLGALELAHADDDLAGAALVVRA